MNPLTNPHAETAATPVYFLDSKFDVAHDADWWLDLGCVDFASERACNTCTATPGA